MLAAGGLLWLGRSIVAGGGSCFLEGGGVNCCWSGSTVEGGLYCY